MAVDAALGSLILAVPLDARQQSRLARSGASLVLGADWLHRDGGRERLFSVGDRIDRGPTMLVPAASP